VLSVKVTATNGNTAAVSLAGVLALDTGDALLDELSRLVDRGHVHLAVDASEVTSCDSSGLGALLRARTRAMNLAGGLTLVGASPIMGKVLRLTGLDRLFGVRS